MCKPQSRGLIADRLERAEQAQPLEDKVPVAVGPPQFRRDGGELGIIPGSRVFPCIFNFNTPETKLELSQTDTALYGVETLIPRGDY